MGPTGKTGVTKPKRETLKADLMSMRHLKTLQHVATDKENLTGRPVIISIKDKDEIKPKLEPKKKQVNSKGIQAGADLKIKAEDLTSEAGPSQNYWEIIAERRRVALEDTLEENRLLHEKLEALESENEVLKQMIEESKNLVDVLTEMVGEQEESGIDMAEASTTSLLDDTQEDASEPTDTSEAKNTTDVTEPNKEVSRAI